MYAGVVFIAAQRIVSLLFMQPVSRNLTTMVLPATVEPMDTMNEEAHVSGRFVNLNRGLAKRASFCIRPSSIRMPVPNSPMNITIRMGTANSRELMRTDNIVNG